MHKKDKYLAGKAGDGTHDLDEELLLLCEGSEAARQQQQSYCRVSAAEASGVRR
jgi:hypothetical protein